LYEPLNSASTDRRLIDRTSELPQTAFMTRRIRANLQGRNHETETDLRSGFFDPDARTFGIPPLRGGEFDHTFIDNPSIDAGEG
jgi:hypothetical protein